MRLLYWLLGLPAPDAIVAAEGWRLSAVSPVGVPGLLLLGLIALGVAGLNLLPHNVMRWRTRLALTLTRLGGFALLALLLARAELRVTVQRSVRPQVAVLTDISASMGLGDAGGQSRLEAARELAAGALRRLSRKADLIPYTFNWQLQAGGSEQAPDGATRLVEAVEAVARRESDLAAIVLLTDGNDTAGDTGGLVAPLLAAQGLPVFPVVFGEPTAPRLTRVRIAGGESYVRLGDEVRLTARLSTTAPEEQAVAVHLYEDGRTEPLSSREGIRLGKEPVEVAFVVKPARPGFRTYRVVAMGVERESVERKASSVERESVERKASSVEREPKESKDAPRSTLHAPPPDAPRSTLHAPPPDAPRSTLHAPRPFLAAEHKILVLNARIRVLYLDIPRDERKMLAHWLARDPVVDLACLTLLPKGGWYGQGALLHKNVGDGLPSQEADLHRYDVVILGDIPRSYFRSGGDTAETKMHQLVEFVSRRGGGLITLGGYAAYAAGQYQGSALARILPFALFTEKGTDEPQAPGRFKASPTPMGLVHPLMQLEWEPQANRDAWLDLPTLDGCNRVGGTTPGATLLAVRELDDAAGATRDEGRGTGGEEGVEREALSVERKAQEAKDAPRSTLHAPPPDAPRSTLHAPPPDAPRSTLHAPRPFLAVMAVQNVGKGKVLSLAMDTTWRWEMQRPAEGEDYFRRFWGNAVRFLAPDPRITPRSPQILRYQSGAAVGQKITLATRLVDDVYKPVSGADLVVKVTSPSGRVTHYYPRDGREAPGVYEYEVALDEPGAWQVAATYRDKTVTEEVLAGASEEELDDPRAKPEAMAELARATGGRAFAPGQAAELVETLETSLAARSPLRLRPRQASAARTTQTATLALWNLPLTMVLLAGLVCLDCYLRKRRGMV